jgi:hypothetical protein
MDTDNFARPATRSRFATPSSASIKSKAVGASKIPGSNARGVAAVATKEQVNPVLPSVVVSPATSYTEFTVS